MKQHIKTVKEFQNWNSTTIKVAEALAEVVKAAERYELVRTLNPIEFKRLWEKNTNNGSVFDDLVDKLIAERK